MSTFVLIHGAWHGGWCWRKVVPLLEAAGHRVLAPDLPGHPPDGECAGEISLETYAGHVCELLQREDDSVVLVGHSMGGGVITQVAEYCPSRVRLLVYVAAYMPRDGCSIADQAREDADSLINKYIEVDREAGLAVLDPGGVHDCFYADCSQEDLRFAQANLCPNPLAPFTSPLSISEDRSDSVARVYVECTRDRTITHPMQRRVHAQCHFEKVYTLDSSHSPFFSTPEALCDCLLDADSHSSGGSVTST